MTTHRVRILLYDDLDQVIVSGWAALTAHEDGTHTLTLDHDYPDVRLSDGSRVDWGHGTWYVMAVAGRVLTVAEPMGA